MPRTPILTLILFLLLVRFNVLFASGEGANIVITDFYSCDALGKPQDYFPKKTTAYFNITVRNLIHDPKNISVHLTVQDELNVPIGSDYLNTTVPPNASTYYIMSIFIPKWAFVGVATAYAGVSIEGVPIDSESTEFYIGPVDIIAPVIRISSPENATYRTESVPLVFTVDERTTWMGYSLNNLKKVTITGNTILTGLANGSYNIIVYANDTSGNVGSSEKVYFTVVIIHDMAVINLECYSTEVYIGRTVNITVLVRNEGTVTETFNVTTYANTTAIETLTVANLYPSNQTTLVFAWDTTGFVKGNYTMMGYITPVPSETDIADNTYMDGIVNVMPRPDIAVTNVIASRTSVEQGYSVSINVTARNQGDYSESFNVTAYANSTEIQTKTVALTSGNSTTLTFTWNTTGVPLGTYTISAYAWPVSGETDIADNTYTDGTVKIVKHPVAAFTYSPTIPFTNQPVTFNASDSYDPDGTIPSYFWDFGDGTNATGVLVEHTYAENGTCTVTLTVTDYDGLTDTDSQNVTVLNRPDIAVTNVTKSKTVVGQGYSVSIGVTAENQGDYTETFNVTVYANETIIETKEVTLTSGNFTTVTFTWNTTSIAKGNYTVSAYATQILGETDLEDNTYNYGIITIAMVGDIVPDGIIDVFDIVTVAVAFGSTPNDPHWNPNADIVEDNIIDIFDLVAIATHFGETDS